MTIKLYELVGSDASRPFSPHCWKVRMALAHKGLDWRGVPVGFTEVPKIENGASKIVPLIRDGDRLVADSFDIAAYLDAAYPDRPSLFGGAGGLAMARMIERWSQQTVQPFLGGAILMDIFAIARDEDKTYFRDSREARYGRRLEEVPAGRDDRRDAFLKSLEPLRDMLKYQPFIGGETPLFPDYIVFGAFQFARIVSPYAVLPADDPVAAWFARCLALHGGEGASVPAAT